MALVLDQTTSETLHSNSINTQASMEFILYNRSWDQTVTTLFEYLNNAGKQIMNDKKEYESQPESTKAELFNQAYGLINLLGVFEQEYKIKYFKNMKKDELIRILASPPKIKQTYSTRKYILKSQKEKIKKLNDLISETKKRIDETDNPKAEVELFKKKYKEIDNEHNFRTGFASKFLDHLSFAHELYDMLFEQNPDLTNYVKDELSRIQELINDHTNNKPLRVFTCAYIYLNKLPEVFSNIDEKTDPEITKQCKRIGYCFKGIIQTLFLKAVLKDHDKYHYSLTSKGNVYYSLDKQEILNELPSHIGAIYG